MDLSKYVKFKSDYRDVLIEDIQIAESEIQAAALAKVEAEADYARATATLRFLNGLKEKFESIA